MMLNSAQTLASFAIASAAVAEPTQSSGFPTAVTTALIAVTGVIIGAVIGYVSARMTSSETRETQEKLSSIAETNKRRERREERDQGLQNEHIGPFFSELTRSFGLAADVTLHVQDVKRRCPLSAPFKRQLITNSGVVEAWGNSGVALSDHRARVLLALNKEYINDFSVTLNQLVVRQTTIVQYLMDSFDFSDEGFQKFNADYKEYKEPGTNLFISTRNAILATQTDDIASVIWSKEGLGDTMFGHAATKLKYRYTKGAASWSAWWNIALPSDPESKAAFESFCAQRDRFSDAVAELDGVLDTSTENTEHEKRHHARLSIQFASQGSLEKFVASLPELKVQTKPLWLESASPQELIT